MKHRSAVTSDGELVDLATMATRVGFGSPVAISDEAWQDCVAWDEDAEECAGQSESGRLMDVLVTALQAQEYAQRLHKRRMEFDVLRVPSGGDEATAKRLVWQQSLGSGQVTITTADEFEG